MDRLIAHQFKCETWSDEIYMDWLRARRSDVWMISREGGGGITPIDWREINWWEIPNLSENKSESARPRHVGFLVDKEQHRSAGSIDLLDTLYFRCCMKWPFACLFHETLMWTFRAHFTQLPEKWPRGGILRMQKLKFFFCQSCQKLSIIKLRVDQDIATNASPTDRNSAFIDFAFQVHSVSFLTCPL